MWLLSAGIASVVLTSPMPRPRCYANARSCGAPLMILEQMKSAVTEMKGQAAEAIVQKKVADKLARAQEKYSIPEKYVDVMSGFFASYMTEIYKAGLDMDQYEETLTTLFTKVLECAKSPYQFEPYHKAIREPFDYYKLGNDFAGGVIDREGSKIVGVEKISEINEKLANGDNVVLLANHQSEADPQIFSVLLDPIAPGFAEKTIFVAGDRVTTDLLAQPFSMGRNLLCIYSKKHLDTPPELKSAKTKHNRRVMKKMQELFQEGGKLIWVAPSGGRDRSDETGKFRVADFDPKSIQMFRLMSDKANRRAHFYPLSMLTYSVCPPPTAVGGDIGERRTVNWSRAGLHFADSVDLKAFVEACVVEGFPKDCNPAVEREAARDALTKHIQSVVTTNYERLAKDLNL